MDMERVDGTAKEEYQGAVALVLDFREGVRAGQSSRGVGLGDALQLPKEFLAGALWVLPSTRGECSSKDVWRSRSGPSRPSCQGPKWSCLLLCICVAGCTD